MRTNVAFNGVGENVKRRTAASGKGADAHGEEEVTAGEAALTEEEDLKRMKEVGRREECRGRVIVNEGDAW